MIEHHRGLLGINLCICDTCQEIFNNHTANSTKTYILKSCVNDGSCKAEFVHLCEFCIVKKHLGKNSNKFIVLYDFFFIWANIITEIVSVSPYNQEEFALIRNYFDILTQSFSQTSSDILIATFEEKQSRPTNQTNQVKSEQSLFPNEILFIINIK